MSDENISLPTESADVSETASTETPVQSTQSSETTSTEPQAPAPIVVPEKIKVGGREYELDSHAKDYYRYLAEKDPKAAKVYLQNHSKALHANNALQDIAAQRKEIERLKSSDPSEYFRFRGIDHEKWIAEEALKMFEFSSKSPEEKAMIQRQAELDRREEELNERVSGMQSESANKNIPAIKKEMQDVASKVGFNWYEGAERDISSLALADMQAQLSQGLINDSNEYVPDFEDILSKQVNQIDNRLTTKLSSATPEQLIAMLGKEGVEKVRKQLLAGVQQNPKPATTQQADAPAHKPKVMGTREWRDKIDSL